MHASLSFSIYFSPSEFEGHDIIADSICRTCHVSYTDVDIRELDNTCSVPCFSFAYLVISGIIFVLFFNIEMSFHHYSSKQNWKFQISPLNKETVKLNF